MNDNEYLESQTEAVEAEPTAEQRAQVLMQYMESPNLAKHMEELDTSEENNLDRIAQRVGDEFEIDLKSREEWLKRNQEGLKQALLVSEEKSYPFKGAANVKYPLLTTASLQFNARAYPAIVQGNRVAKALVVGDDTQGLKAQRGERVSEHLSWQLLEEMPEWEPDTDRMLLQLPIVGCMFRKVYYDPSIGRKCSRMLMPDKVVYNYWARSIEEVPRITEELSLYPYEIEERIRSGRFIEFDYTPSTAGKTEDNKETDPDDKDRPHVFLEQHRLLDLDGDGYPEPYVVTVHKDTKKTCRIVANWDDDDVTFNGNQIAAIRRNDYYIKYEFLPAIDGGAYGWGFGELLGDIGEAINTTLNQMLDAGHLSNIQGGLVSAQMGIKEKHISIAPGEWKVIHSNAPMNQAVFPIKYDGPSPVLFQLLGMLVEAGRDIAAIKDVLTGEVRQNMTASATLALIEQGMQVFTSIFKRIHRSLKSELNLHCEINAKNLTPQEYNNFFDGEQPFNPAEDYGSKDKGIQPVSDPTVSSRMQELAKANFILDVATGRPEINQTEALMRVLTAGQVEDVDKLLVPPPQPDPEVEWMTKLAAALELDDKAADIMKKHTAAMKDIADVDAEEGNQSLARAKLMLEAITRELEAENGQGRLPELEGQPSNAMGPNQAGATVTGNGVSA